MVRLLGACSFDDLGTNPRVEPVPATRLWAPLVGVFHQSVEGLSVVWFFGLEVDTWQAVAAAG
jgi:hypothetical protein